MSHAIIKVRTMDFLSKRIYSLSESATLAMTRMGRELAAKGHDVISLSIGEPDFDTPEFIKDAAKKALDENYTHYTPVPGFPELRQAICTKLKRDNGLDYTPDQIVVSTGAKQALANAIMSLVNPGDEVVVPTPYWVSYSELIKLAEGRAVYIPTSVESDFKLTPQQLESSITPLTKLIMLNSPNNPSGSIYHREEIEALVEVLLRHPNVYVLSDEIYELINFSGKHESFASFDGIRDRVVIINGVSKGYAMTGWRIGYLAAPRYIAEAATKYQGQITSGTNAMAQRAAIDAMLADPAEVTELHEMLAAFKERRDLVYDRLKKIPGINVNKPDGAFYLFPEIKSYIGKSFKGEKINTDQDLCMYLLRNAFVSLVPGSAFGNGDCLRISYATSPEKLNIAMDRIEKALQDLD